MATEHRRAPSGNRKPPESRGSAGRREHSTDDRAEKMFLEELETRVQYFMRSDSQELEFEPMNSFKRRLVHQVSKPYTLKTESRGEEPGRYVCLVKTEQSAPPEGAKMARAWDFGTQSIAVDPGEAGLRIALKTDGSVEIFRDADRHLDLDQKLVTTRQFRIRGGKIVVPGDPAW